MAMFLLAVMMVMMIVVMVMLMVVALIISPLTTLALSGQRRPSLVFPSTAEHSPSSTQTQTGELKDSQGI